MATPQLLCVSPPTASSLSELVLSTLTGRAVHISQIRPSDPIHMGLAPHEISFLRLLEAVTNGSHMEISYTGTIVLYKPGLITGSAPGSGASGGVIKHEIPSNCSRGISYFLLPMCLLAPFSKAPFNILFTGPGVITSSTPTGDMSVDNVSSAPLVAAPTRDNPSNKKKIGLGFGLSLVAESSTGCLFSADVASLPTGGKPPEDISKRGWMCLESCCSNDDNADGDGF
ncbi:conserved hypothetical protein [Histoplasma mississippiense (nom. inval.)]|uniref:conserved hypothetical protein n=1 Tax=Ajellomyces capsulatus (strain NAm1 / WU24) TaxID=2059318 RepID=UPI000157BD37|nr:conserved hypothetical protein [Histoplasma mississippiense (nom. inval.)]EDN06146.1 conserved hypothetical protein [Histoplasma mississippiense (nom. inval.)]